MASEDVLEMAENWVRVFEHRGSYPGDGYDGRDMVLALAAEVRELRKDKARLIELFRSFAQKINVDGHHPAANAIEAICDAAMGDTQHD